MQSVQAGAWDPRPPSKHVSPSDSSHPPRLTHVGAPAKRITFYKSGDSQFGGVKMAVHKRSFKCFDALLDDLSQKVPLPFGVRTVTTPRGTHTIRHIEQLQDGGCYLCSDRRQAKPINMDIAAKRPGVWYHHGRRPHRPGSPSATPPGHVPYRQRRLLLVKNTEPGVSGSIVLSRRITRSLRAFLEEASDVMQFHVRKIYTVEGRKIDNIQSLMTCPNVLVCVGREAFSSLLVNYIRKNSDEKLPGLGPRTRGNGAKSPSHGGQSRASEHSEGQESKKNTVNFGLETKKSIIHPRSDSSNRSARFSMSSEKSYGISALSQGRNGIMNDDIEKRVVVNKDGSLSVEMRVRFRLHCDETLQWSTQIKKSPSLTNESCSISQSQSHYLQQGQSESCSDPDCNSFEPEVADYTSQCAMDENRCPCCYRHEQKFDLWENPAHCHKQPVPPSHTTSQSQTIMRRTHSSSSSSSCNSRRVVRCRARLTNDRSEHSEIVQEEMCVTEEVKHIVEQDVEVCTVSRSCSQSEAVTIERHQSGKSGEDELERPMSGVSASSHVLQELKEDDDDEEELPPSASQCCHSNEQTPTPEIHIDNKPASIASANNKQDGSNEEEPSACHCLVTAAEASERVSKASCRSSKNQETADLQVEEVKRVVSGLSANSRQSATYLCPNCGGWKQKAGSESNSRASHRSHRSNNVSPKRATPQDDANNANDNASDVSTHSNKSNLTNHGRASVISSIGERRASSAMSKQEVHEVEDVRAISATSHRSNRSHKSNCNERVEDRSPSAVSAKSEKSNCNAAVLDVVTREEADGENTLERPVSTVSAKSGASAKTNNFKKSSIKVTPPSTAEDEEETNPRAPSTQSVKSEESRPASAVSIKSTKSNVLRKSQNGAEEMRAASTLSVKSNNPAKENRPTSATSAKSNKSVQNDQVEEDTRAPSAQSVKSNTLAKESRPASANSTKSYVSEKSCQNENGEEATRAASALSTKEAKESRPASAISAWSTKSHVSAESKNVDEDTRAGSALSEKLNSSPKESRPASAMSVKSTRSKVSTQNENIEEEPRAASAFSVKSTQSKASEKSSANDNVEDEPRGPSALSAKESRPASATSAKSTKTNVSEKSQNVKEEARPSSVVSTKSNKSNKITERALYPKSNADEDGEDRGGSVLSVKSAKLNMSAKSKCIENCEDEEKFEARTVNVLSVSSQTKKSSRASSPAKEKKEDNRATSAMSAKTHTSAISTKLKMSNHTELYANVNDDDDKKSEKASTVTSAKSNTSRKFHVVTIKTPEDAEKVNDDRPISSASAKTEKCNTSTTSKLNITEKEDENESIVEDSAPKSRSSNRSRSPKQKQELMHENGDARGTSALSVCSGKSVKSSQSKCSFGKNKGTDANETTDNSEVATPKRGELEVIEHQLSQDSFASVSLVLPEDQDSESKTTTPEVTKSVENMEEVEQIDKNNSPAIDIPTIETPGEDEGNDAGRKKIQVASSCSTKSAYSVKSNKSSCSCCGKLTAQADANGADSPVAKSSIKSVSTTKTSKLTVQDSKTASEMSSTSTKSQKKLQNDNVDANDTNLEGSRPESNANEEDKQTKSKSSCSLKPKSVVSNQSSTKASSKKGKDSSGSVKSCQNKEENANPSSPNALQCSRPASKGDTCCESILSHSLSAADLLKEAMATNAEPPQSPARSKASKTSSSRPKSSKTQRHKKEEPDLMPSCLPNASPNEVVSDWLRSIPANSSMLALGDETHELTQDKDDVEKCVEDAGMENSATGEEENKDEDKNKPEGSEDEEGSPKKAPVETFETNTRPNTMVNDGSLPKSWHSSAAVMKVLLNSSLGRCRSMPEVSPVYGRRLSSSAKELLDCLTQLQLIGPAYSVQKDQRPQFEDIIAILQSLWLTEPQDIADPSKDPNGTDQVTPPRSSSGVGMSSGSGGSGKDNVNQEDDPKNEHGKGGQMHEEAKTDTAEEVPDSPKTNENPSSLDKNSKSPTDNEPDTLERSSLGSPPTVVRAPLTKHHSQDPNPLWVLHLLKKLEKQFINHYVNAMAEFKVRWDLEDNLILDKMIVELRDEVSQRIQSSVEQEMKKIQGRAGKGMRVPRPPPGDGLSRESTMTEKRRRLLKVIKNQSVKTGESLSDGELTADNSDQRSDDEYCPCEACMRKKMAARPLKTNPNAIEAPVQMEFDLLKILQLKKSPTPVVAKPEPNAEEASDAFEKEMNNLEAVQEEEEDEESKMEDKTSVEEECHCECSKDDEEDDEETEESDKETVRENSSHEETVQGAAKQTVSNKESTGAEEEEGEEED